MVSAILLLVAIVSAALYPRVQGNARLFFGLIMLASIGGFLYTFMHLAHPGL
jgi:hypothetical protein